MEAQMGSYPSYTWPSLLWGRELLHHESRWCIGNGRSVRVYDDAWVPNERSAPLQAQSNVWRPLPEGWFKLNVDGAVDTRGGKKGVRAVIRDWNGVFQCVIAMPIPCLTCPGHAGHLFFVQTWAKTTPFCPYVLKKKKRAASSSSSCSAELRSGFLSNTWRATPTPTTPAPRGRVWELQGCFHGFQGVVRPRRPHCGSAPDDTCFAPEGNFVEEVRDLTVNHHLVLIAIPREANGAAYRAARYSLHEQGFDFWTDVGPPWLTEILNLESVVA
ncbi:hypothetical protein ACFX1Z_045105 [Malus domestica]